MRLRVILMLWPLAVALTQAPAKPAASAPISQASVRDQLLGAWRLVKIETIRSNGEIIFPFYGRNPEGLLVYDRSGWMSVQIVSDPKPSVPSASSREGFLASPLSERASAADGFYAYYGTWEVDASGHSVTHHIKQSLYPAERGEDAVRQLTIEGDRLILTAKSHEMGEDHVRRLVWERANAEGR